MKSYDELISLPTFEERFKYCQSAKLVGDETFGGHRYLNQRFYASTEWRRIRARIIMRDNACDLAVPGYEIGGSVYIHHLNPMAVEDLIQKKDWVLLPQFLVCCSFDTHQALHYGGESNYGKMAARTKNDTAPWIMEERTYGQHS